MSNDIAFSLPAPKLSIYGASNFALTMRVLSLSAQGGPGMNAVAIAVPAAVLTAQAGANSACAMPMATLQAAATAVGFGSFGDVVPAALVSASGTVPILGQVAASIPMFSMVGYAGSMISVTVPAGTLLASGGGGAVGTIAASLPLFNLVASGTAQNHGSANLLMPLAKMTQRGLAWVMAPAAQLVAIGSAAVAVTYEGYSLNLKHGALDAMDELTKYTNFPFDRIVRYRNSYFGMNSTGLYLLEGTTDNGTAIAYKVKTALSDNKTPHLKTVNSVYLSGRLGPAATITLFAGESGSNTYSYSTPRDSSPKNYRQVLGRGVKTRYFGLEVDGAAVFELDAMDFNITTLTRKV